MNVVYSTEARVDLVGIGAWIAQDNPRRAASFVDELRDACESLGDMPYAFPVLELYKLTDIRKRPYRRYIIFYRVQGERVEILHVIHSARNHEAILFGGED